jgi:hypothetical protein
VPNAATPRHSKAATAPDHHRTLPLVPGAVPGAKRASSGSVSPGTATVGEEADPVVVVASSPVDAHAASKQAIRKAATPIHAARLITDAKLAKRVTDATADESMLTQIRHEKSFAHTAKLAFSSTMAEFEGEPGRIWDEYEWERFLQQQDGKTEKYMQLLETYLDDPERDEIIAREMGWTQLLDDKDWSAEVDALLDERQPEEDDSDVADASTSAETFEEHQLYRAAFALTIWIDQLFDENASLQNEPAAVKLATHAALASAKLAAALSGDNVDEIGMTIAYLKRALKAITIAMDAATQLRNTTKQITRSQYVVLQQRLFEVRDGIVTMMGEYRSEWRRRFGSEDYRG